MTKGNRASNKKKCYRKQQVDDSNKMVLLFEIASTEMRGGSMITILCLLEVYFTRLLHLFFIPNMSIYYNNVLFFYFV
jgi:hypothetical protein